MTTRLTSRLGVFVAAVTAVVFVGCKDLTQPKAQLSIFGDSTTVYALNGAPPGAPTALYMFTGQPVAADASFRFDVAYDIDPTGAIVLLPVRAVGNGLASSPHRVGLLISTEPFDAINEAPKSGYRYDSSTVVRVGQAVLVQSADPIACATSLFGTTIYGKLVVDSINRSTRRLHTRYRVDPNCGFVSLGTGIPDK
jgi:hypothetical protein